MYKTTVTSTKTIKFIWCSNSSQAFIHVRLIGTVLTTHILNTNLIGEEKKDASYVNSLWKTHNNNGLTNNNQKYTTPEVMDKLCLFFCPLYTVLRHEQGGRFSDNISVWVNLSSVPKIDIVGQS